MLFSTSALRAAVEFKVHRFVPSVEWGEPRRTKKKHLYTSIRTNGGASSAVNLQCYELHILGRIFVSDWFEPLPRVDSMLSGQSLNPPVRVNSQTKQAHITIHPQNRNLFITNIHCPPPLTFHGCIISDMVWFSHRKLMIGSIPSTTLKARIEFTVLSVTYQSRKLRLAKGI